MTTTTKPLTGRRKEAVARVRLLPGSGKTYVNGKSAIEYLRREEWAMMADDILWRRSKLGLHLPADATDTLTRWLMRK